jgi:hypothetical protein
MGFVPPDQPALAGAVEPGVDEEKHWGKRLHTPPANHEMGACHPKENRDALARGSRELLQVRRVLPAEHELAARKIEGR